MTHVEVGLGLQADKRPGHYARLAALAQAHGFDVISVFGDLLYQPPIVPLLEIAAATDRLRLGAACWNPYTMHPYEIAGQFAALDKLSGGRAYLGLARGTWLERIGVAQPQPVSRLREAVAVIKALLDGGGEGIRGEHFTLEPGTKLRYPLPESPPPVLIGTWGPRTAALAGEIADEVKIGGTANPTMVEVMRERIEVGCRMAGRAIDDVGIVVGAVTVVDEDAAAARALARTEVAMYLAVVADLDPTAHVPAALRAEVSRLVGLGDEAAAGRLIPDEVLDVFAFWGTPEQVAAQAQRLIDAGVARVEFGTPHGRTDEHGIDLLGSVVLPLLSRG